MQIPACKASNCNANLLLCSQPEEGELVLLEASTMAHTIGYRTVVKQMVLEFSHTQEDLMQLRSDGPNLSEHKPRQLTWFAYTTCSRRLDRALVLVWGVVAV